MNTTSGGNNPHGTNPHGGGGGVSGVGGDGGVVLSSFSGTTDNNNSDQGMYLKQKQQQQHQQQQQQQHYGLHLSDTGLGSIPLQPGEFDEYERPLSAPPPPGFNSGGAEGRNRMANELLWGTSSNAMHSASTFSNINNSSNNINNNNNNNFDGSAGAHQGNFLSGKHNDFALSNNNSQLQQQQQQQQQQQHHRDFPYQRSASGGLEMPDDRASSFTNLSGILGSSLVQSMEDATKERMFASDDPQLSYHRMTRHAANRLLGASPPVHTTMDSHQHQHQQQQQQTQYNQQINLKQAPPPSSLFGQSQQQHHHQQHQQQQQKQGVAQSNNAYASSSGRSMGNRVNGENGQQQHQQHQQQSLHHDPYLLEQSPYHSSTQPQQQHQQMSARLSSHDTMGQIRQGFPTSLSSPDRTNNASNKDDFPENTARRSTPPGQQMYPGHAGSGHQRRGLPSKDIGMNVMEPDESDNQISAAASGIVSHRIDQNQFDAPVNRHNVTNNNNNNNIITSTTMSALERGVQNLWHPEAREFRPAVTAGSAAAAGPPSGNSSISDSANNTDVSPRTAEYELKPYLWDVDQRKPSRTIAILHCSYVRVPDVRSACETYGVLESFRADFATKGIFFATYYDIRSAQYAAMELQSILQRLSVMQRSSEEVVVRYCVSLTASSQFDESQILISDLPPDISDYALKSMLSSYGALRSVINQGDGCYLVEFHNLQDSKQALLELDSSQPWGTHVTFEVGLRNPIERKKGRELLAMIGRWRHGLNRQGSDSRHFVSGGTSGGGLGGVGGGMQGGGGGVGGDSWQSNDIGGAVGSNRNQNDMPQTQFILGPDGRYTQVVVQPASGGFSHFSQANATAFDPRHQQLIQGPNGQIFIASIPQVSAGQQVFLQQPTTLVAATSQIVDGGGSSSRRNSSGTPYYTHIVTSDVGSLSGRSHRSAQSQNNNEDKDTRHLLLDLDIVEGGQDTRTSLMVRNIPNKYTQQMLLNEFEENGHGPGIIDFFYLPIDFKNRCNRGYAFINFVDFKDIIPFHRRYFGKHWRTFNSDKICDITYARIQGKAAMLKRFENSALMEKDDEYKPLVFVSDGPDKGKRLPFPDPSALLNSGPTPSNRTTL